MKKNKYMIGFAAGILTSLSIFTGVMSASAATIDDVARVAREMGISESYIQAGYNNYYKNPDKYTSEDFDNAIACLYLYGEDSEQAIMDYFGVSAPPATTTSTNSSTSPTTNTTTVAPTSPTENNNNNTGNSNTGSSNGNTQQGSENSSRPIGVAEFLKMTIDEKKAFINSLPDEEKAVFLSSLTKEERNSIIKSLPTDTKLDILSNFIDAGNSMGLNMQIEDIEGDKLSMSIRDDNGTLIDVSNVGVVVADTGYDYTLFTIISGIIVLAASFGLYVVFKKMSAEEKAEDNNGIK